MIFLVLFWFMGGFVDSALWGHSSYNTPKWVVGHLDIIWLALSQFLLPLGIVMILKPKLNTFIAFMSAAFFGSMVWDLTYSLLTRGTLISNSMEHWFSINDIGLVIGVSAEFAWAFYLVRFVIGVSLFVWLKKRLDTKL